eukprot:scaffold18440_cov18-Tisochrysis_lutea.AAC.1
MVGQKRQETALAANIVRRPPLGNPERHDILLIGFFGVLCCPGGCIHTALDICNCCMHVWEGAACSVSPATISVLFALLDRFVVGKVLHHGRHWHARVGTSRFAWLLNNAVPVTSSHKTWLLKSL